MKTDRDIELARFTTLRVGGRPLWYVRPADYGELAAALEVCSRQGVRFRVLGGGSNVLVDDGELPFVVIHVCSPAFDWIRAPAATTLRVGAGVHLSRLLAYCRDAGLSGLEFLVGIPGTVGGAIAGNAGAWGRSISDCLTRVWLGDAKATAAVCDDLHFSYRESSVGGRIVAEAEFQLEPCRPALVEGRMEEHLARKAGRQPVGVCSAGCVFKNPAEHCAGLLLERCGVKGRRVGEAEVSAVHANFIVNRQNASARDVLALLEMMRREVSVKFGVHLELEVKHWEAERKVA